MTSTAIEVVQVWMRRVACCLLLLSLADGRATLVDEDILRRNNAGSKMDGIGRRSIVQLGLERRVHRTRNAKRDDEAGTHAIGLGDSQDVYAIFLSHSI